MKFAVLVVVAIALAACGGKSKPSTMTNESPLIQGTGGTTYGGASYGGAAYGGAAYGGAAYGGMRYGGGGPNR